MSLKPLLSDVEVGRLRDIGLQMDVLGRQMARLRAAQQNIVAKRAQTQGRQFTDHALVRYMERIEGVDMEAIKDRARAFLERGTPTDVKGVSMCENGTIAIINRHGVVVTFLPQDADLGDRYEPD